MNSTVPLCLCHECSKDCHLPDCQLLAYVRELERDKARLDWLEYCVEDQKIVTCQREWGHFYLSCSRRATGFESLRLAIDAAMQAMRSAGACQETTTGKEGKCPKCGEALTCKSAIGYDRHNREQEADWVECPKCGFTQP